MPEALGRLKPGLTIQQAQQRLDAFVAELSRSHPTEYPAASRWSVRLESIEESWTASVRPMLVVLLAAVGFVLLIVAVNVASLLVARSSARTKEMAVRQALGASHLRLVRQLLTESVLLSLAGGMSAVAVLALAKKSLLALMPADLPRLNEVHFDARVVALAFALSLLTGVLFGLTPALHASDTDPNEDLKEGARSGSPSARKNRFRGFLVAVEIALSVVLLSAAGLLLHSFWNSMQSNPGCNPNQLMVARIRIPFPNNPAANPYRTAPPITAMSHEVLRLARELPGVQEAAMGGDNSVPLVNSTQKQILFSLPDEPDSSQKQRTTETALVNPEYFHVLRIPLLRGRWFTEADTDKTKPVVVVSESFARQYLKKRDLGTRIGFEPRTYEIVGVVGGGSFTGSALTSATMSKNSVVNSDWPARLWFSILKTRISCLLPLSYNSKSLGFRSVTGIPWASFTTTLTSTNCVLRLANSVRRHRLRLPRILTENSRCPKLLRQP